MTFLFFSQNGGTSQIIGIKHTDYKSHPVKVTLQAFVIGDPKVTIQIESQRNHGINSEFTFYTN